VAPLAVTLGEPAGIGPDLILSMAQSSRNVPWVVVGSKALLLERARLLGLNLRVDSQVERPSMLAGELTVEDVGLYGSVIPGELDKQNSRYVLEALRIASEGCLSGIYRGLVTGPIQKSVINAAGYPFTGHTEFLKEAFGVEDVVMLLVADSLRVAIATTHMPLSEVANSISTVLIHSQISILLEGLVDLFNVQEPKLLVAGLNPHAGESGHLGSEEIEVINPVCDGFRKAGYDVVGPMPADSLFTKQWLSKADAVLAMYHDQGLPVLKHAGFGKAVNVTLGLPFIRTSVDHGTALDLAGSSMGDTGSFEQAILLADQLS